MFQTHEKYLYDAHDNVIRVVRTADVEPQLDAIAAIRDHIRPNTGPGEGKYLGTIPNIIAAQWAKECGAAIGTKEWGKYAKRKLADGSWKRLTGNY